MLATLVDTTMGAAVRSAVDEEAPATSQLTVTYALATFALVGS